MTQTAQRDDSVPAKNAGMAVVHRPDLDRQLRRLEVVGDTDLMKGGGVAVVGARSTTTESVRWARALGKVLAEEGEVVVSGGALGIDGAAHEGALDGSGKTIVVLGTGVDVPYPQRHRPLFAKVVARGGALVSPFPSGTAVRRHNFPVRNPLIAALSRAVVVVEANVRSGSLSTASAATKLGLPLYVRAGSAGCDLLIARGAIAVNDVDAVVAHVKGRPLAVAPSTPLLDALASPQSPDALAAHLDLRLDDLLSTLLELETEGRIIRLPDGRCLALRQVVDTKE